MRFSLTALLRNRDAFGHPIGVYFNGEDSYQTLLGGFMTLVAQILTFVLITQAIQEIIGMEEPVVTMYENFLDADARDEIGPVSLKDSGTIIAV